MPRVVEHRSPFEPQHREPTMARKPQDNDDSEDLPMPNKAEIDRILRGVVPQTPDWVKEKTSQTRGQAYAQYEGSGAPAKAKRDDTLDIAGPVVVDDTQVDGLQLSPMTLQRIEKRREQAEQRNDSTVSVDMAHPTKRKSIYPIAGLLLLAAIGLVIWFAQSRSATTGDTPITTASAISASPSASIDVPPVQTETTQAAAPTSSNANLAPSAPINSASSAKPTHTAVIASAGSSNVPPSHPSASASGRPDLAVTPF